MKKLPFKPTALRKPSFQSGSSEDDSKAGDNCDGLALFRRSKEMEPIMAADRERRMRKKQRQDEERKRQPAPLTKRPREDDDDKDSPGGPSDDRVDVFEQPLGTRDQSMPAVDLSRPSDAEDCFSEPVTPPASKRSRADSTPSKVLSLGCDEAALVSLDSPSTRRMRSRSHLTTPSHKSQDIAIPSHNAQADALMDSPSMRRGRSQSGQATPSNRSQPSAVAPPSAQATPFESDDDDDDSDDEDDSVRSVATPTTRRSTGAEIVGTVSAQSQPPADEFGEYVRRAEEQRARDRVLLGSGADKGQSRETVDILITSTVPNTKPCRMKYLFDKPLRVVRNTWAAVQRRHGVELPLHNDDDVILTWRRKRVYVFSTLFNLGIRPQGDGLIQVDGHGREGLAEGRTRIHMEAWTPELFQEMEKQEELRRRRQVGELSDESGDEAAEEPPTPEVKIRVILKAPGLEDVKLTVRPETTVETLVTGFRTQRSIGSEKDVNVVFEGERLEEHTTMEDAEIADMDLIDVHVR